MSINAGITTPQASEVDNGDKHAYETPNFGPKPGAAQAHTPAKQVPPTTPFTGLATPPTTTEQEAK